MTYHMYDRMLDKSIDFSRMMHVLLLSNKQKKKTQIWRLSDCIKGIATIDYIPIPNKSLRLERPDR